MKHLNLLLLPIALLALLMIVIQRRMCDALERWYWKR
jgi:hypothetical protein